MEKSTWSWYDPGSTYSSGLSATHLSHTGKAGCVPQNLSSTEPSTVVGDSPYFESIDLRTVLLEEEGTPGWREIARKGDILPVTNYKVRRQLGIQAPAIHTENCYKLYSYYSRHKQKGTAHAYSVCSVQSSPPDLVVNLDMLLQGAAADAQSLGWDILVDLAESPKTIQLFYQWYKRFRDRKKHIRKLVWKSFRDPRTKRLTRLSNIPKSIQARMLENEFLRLWLESRYGWRPLVYSAEAISDAMSAWTEAPEFRIVKARRREIVSGSTPPVIGGNRCRTQDTYIPVISESNSSHKRTLTGRGFFIGKMEADAIKEGALNLNPFSSGLELIGYEFVIGWFLNHMDLARAHWPSARYTQSAMGVSTLDEEEVDVNYYSWPQGGNAAYTDGQLALRETTYTRERRSSVPWDISYRAKLSPAKLVDLKALFFQNAFGDMTPAFQKLNGASKHRSGLSSGKSFLRI